MQDYQSLDDRTPEEGTWELGHVAPLYITTDPSTGDVTQYCSWGDWSRPFGEDPIGDLNVGGAHLRRVHNLEWRDI